MKRKLIDISEEIEVKKKELNVLIDEYDNVFESNESLNFYYSEKEYYENEIKKYKYRIEELGKLIYLEECGISTDSDELKYMLNCESNCDSYKHFGYESCRDCETSYSKAINDLYTKEFNKRNNNQLDTNYEMPF